MSVVSESVVVVPSSEQQQQPVVALMDITNRVVATPAAEAEFDKSVPDKTPAEEEAAFMDMSNLNIEALTQTSNKAKFQGTRIQFVYDEEGNIVETIDVTTAVQTDAAPTVQETQQEDNEEEEDDEKENAQPDDKEDETVVEQRMELPNGAKSVAELLQIHSKNTGFLAAGTITADRKAPSYQKLSADDE